MKRSGLSAICMTFATDYQPGDAYDRFLRGLASMDRQLERNGMKRSLPLADIRTTYKNGQPTVIQAVEGGHFTTRPVIISHTGLERQLGSPNMVQMTRPRLISKEKA